MDSAVPSQTVAIGSIGEDWKVTTKKKNIGMKLMKCGDDNSRQLISSMIKHGWGNPKVAYGASELETSNKIWRIFQRSIFF